MRRTKASSVISKSRDHEKALVFAPHGRDAQLAVVLLKESSIAASACADLDTLAAALGSDVTLIVISEEAVRLLNVAPLKVWIDNQPPWSDLSFIVMTQKGGGLESNPSAARLVDTLGNLSFLERPFHPTTFAGMAMLAGKLGSWSIDIASEKLITSALCRAIYGLPETEELTYAGLLGMIHPGDLAQMQEAVRRASISAKTTMWNTAPAGPTAVSTGCRSMAAP